ncbi:hypothetical protein BI364_03215 [Acidihalobacter yilgarnensis]|uniref:Uncharacterized protein n=1 Tax=Acidihalobacter yilgarnensis TaxID=2819280 RepID=A0A1D8IL33_9GAMM|nr:hypothetical protein [Acidihalobacter yilgarnensis]AOU97143.1 hypothetical protein BI364_03215 [Acidihalobacter yilgarnensis]
MTGTLAAFVFLFPKASLDRQLAQDAPVTAATLAYLTLMTHASPGDQALHILLARKALQAGNLTLAERALAPWPDGAIGASTAIVSLRLTIHKVALLATAPDSAARRDAIARYRRSVMRAAPLLPLPDLLAQARIGLGLGLYDTAVALSSEVLRRATTTRDRTSAFRLGIDSLLASGDPEAALRFAIRETQRMMPPSAMLWRTLFHLSIQAGKPGSAARYAQSWYQLADSPAQRRKAFDAVVEAYLSAGRPDIALQTARTLLPGMHQDRSLWRRMTRLALSANQPRLAAHYARLLVGLPESGP